MRMLDDSINQLMAERRAEESVHTKLIEQATFHDHTLQDIDVQIKAAEKEMEWYHGRFNLQMARHRHNTPSAAFRTFVDGFQGAQQLREKLVSKEQAVMKESVEARAQSAFRAVKIDRLSFLITTFEAHRRRERSRYGFVASMVNTASE